MLFFRYIVSIPKVDSISIKATIIELEVIIMKREFEQTEDILFLDGLFFLKKHLIRANPPLVQEAFEELYTYLCNN